MALQIDIRVEGIQELRQAFDALQCRLSSDIPPPPEDLLHGARWLCLRLFTTEIGRKERSCDTVPIYNSESSSLEDWVHGVDQLLGEVRDD